MLKNKCSQFFPAILIVLLTLFVSCTKETYKSGDGAYSYLRGDLAVMKTDARARVVSFVTDDDATVSLKAPLAVDGIKADTTYRALIYYNQPVDADVRIVNMKMVNVCKPFEATKEKPLKTDPVGWESLWVSHNKAYLNIGLNLLVGVSDDENADKKQSLGICQDSIVGRHFYYTLYHNQNGVPEYYTYKTFMSMPLDESFASGDILMMTVNTYDGVQQKTIVLP